MKRVALLLLFAVAISVLTACGDSTTTGNTNNNGSNTITMGASNFSPTSITISKGSTITFNNSQDSGTIHILVVGSNGTAESEAGAPDFGGTNGTTVEAGKSFTTGAWNTAGTFHVTCTVHPTTMNLTITVTG